MLFPTLQQLVPIFSNDLVGYVKLAITVVVTGSGAVYFVAWWVRRGPDAAIKELQRDLNGVGARVASIERNDDLQAAFQHEVSRKETRLDGEREQFRERVKAIEVLMEKTTKDINEHHAEQRMLIEETGRRQTEALHKLELQIARLNERSDLGECFDRLGSSIERALMKKQQGDR